MCLTIICGKADVRPALSEIRRVYQRRSAASPCLPYNTIWVEQARSRWERSERYRDGVRGDLTFLLAHTVFALLVHAWHRSRRVCFGRAAGGTALPAGRSHDKTRFFLPHTRRAASQSRMPCDSMNPGVCHRSARLSPREGMSQLHILYGLEGGISNRSHDALQGSTVDEGAASLHCGLRAPPRAPAASSHAAQGICSDCYATQAAHTHRTCSRFARSQAQSRPGYHAPFICQYPQPNGLRSRCPRVELIACM